jgi:hypothetical protein
MKRLLALFLVVVSVDAFAGPLVLSENFDNITTLAGSGWVQTNNSTPIAATGWFQGNAGIFPSQAGAPNSYIAANFLNAAAGGDISNWLISPTLALGNGAVVQFYTRTEVSPAAFPDRLELRLSTNGASTNVGGTATSVGDFTTLLLTVNPGLSSVGYPDSWTQFSATLSGLGGPVSARLGIRYNVTNTNTNANYIGIDTVRVFGVPEPTSLALGALGLAMLGFAGRRGRRA